MVEVPKNTNSAPGYGAEYLKELGDVDFTVLQNEGFVAGETWALTFLGAEDANRYRGFRKTRKEVPVTASDSIVVQHNMPFEPVVNVYDTAGDPVTVTNVTHSAGEVTVALGSVITGRLILS